LSIEHTVKRMINKGGADSADILKFNQAIDALNILS
jgi:hypothetical protein